MKGKPCSLLEACRTMASLKGPSELGRMWGAFLIPFGTGRLLAISSGRAEGNDPGCPLAWEHVSVSCENRTPTWDEMAYVKSLFWRRDECVIEYHPPAAVYINKQPNVLHLWKPPVPVVMPPLECV